MLYNYKENNQGGIEMNKIFKFAGITLLSVLLLIIAGCGSSEESINTFDKIKEEGKLVIGTEPSYRPFEYYDKNDNIIGFDIDVAHAIAEELGVELEIKDIAFDGLLPSLNTNKFDMVIAAMTITDKRKNAVDFSESYFNAGQVITVLEDNNQIKSVEDLQGNKVGVQLGTTADITMSEMDNIEVSRYEQMTQAFIDLRNGRIDAVANDLAVAAEYIKKKAGAKIVGKPFTEENFGMAIRKEDDKLEEEINGALQSIKDNGKYDEIYEKWFK